MQTAVVGPEAPRADPDPARPAFILLHGFDSSSLEFRRFVPLLEQLGDVYAVDLAGWGFTDFGAAGNPDLVLGALGALRRALLCFERVPQNLDSDCSLGGTLVPSVAGLL